MTRLLAAQLTAVRRAMWSVYYHSTHLRALTKPALAFIPAKPGAPHSILDLMPLDEAIDVLTGANDADAPSRRLRALRKLAAGGFANAGRRDSLLHGVSAADRERILRIEAVWNAMAGLVDRISQERGIDLGMLGVIDLEGTDRHIDTKLMMSSGCATVGVSSTACYTPQGASTGGQPVTTVTAGAHVNRTLPDLAQVLDPRTWATCSDAFETSQRVVFSGGQYNPVPHAPADLGQPWDGWLHEVVVLGDIATFHNYLAIEFTVQPQEVRLNYLLTESGQMAIPSLFVNEPAGLTKNKGFVLAVESLDPNYPASDGWKYIEVVKTVRFVDFTAGGANPWGIDPGEILNYLAPVILSLWLDEATQGGACC